METGERTIGVYEKWVEKGNYHLVRIQRNGSDEKVRVRERDWRRGESPQAGQKVFLWGVAPYENSRGKEFLGAHSAREMTMRDIHPRS